MTLANYELLDPAALMDEVSARVPLGVNRAYLILVADPSTHQTVLSVTEMTAPAVLDGYDAVDDETRKLVQNLAVPGSCYPPRHMVVTVIVRHGLCVFGPNESRWLMAWRYSHHFTDVYDGELILVTEHGWCDFTTGFAGHTPALGSSAGDAVT